MQRRQRDGRIRIPQPPERSAPNRQLFDLKIDGRGTDSIKYRVAEGGLVALDVIVHHQCLSAAGSGNKQSFEVQLLNFKTGHVFDVPLQDARNSTYSAQVLHESPSLMSDAEEPADCDRPSAAIIYEP